MEPHKLSRAQSQIIDDVESWGDRSGVSAFSLVEIALLSLGGRLSKAHTTTLLNELETNPAFQILPMTTDIAWEIATLGGALRDPADQTIVATARVHRLQLVTSDQRIIDSQLVRVID